MVRSAHKKSRRGCATCKRRHVKCDETKPGCINCATVNRRCAYLDEENSTNYSSANQTFSSTSSPQINIVAQQSPMVRLPPDIPEDLVHVHALNQWMCHTQEIFCPASTKEHHPGTIMLDHALKYPFLLHGLLALATFHLGHCQLAHREIYYEHSRKLLSRGLEGFNGVVTHLNEENIIPAFVFSTVAGFCRFSHVFSHSHSSVSEFLDRLIEAITMLRGVSIVLGGWWSYITASTLFKALYPDAGPPEIPTNTQDSGELSDLKHFLQGSNLDLASVVTCNEAVDQLQSLYNSQSKDTDPDKTGTPEFVWFMKLPGAFHTLVLQRKPEALIVVGYLAPLLHRRRRYWLVGNAGEVLINALHDYLSPEWQRWLQAPTAAIRSDTWMIQ